MVVSARVALGALVAVAASLPTVARAQSKTECSYATCALRIAPKLSGLDVVRGDTDERAGSLSFLWPTASLASAFEGDPGATVLARSSVRKRRTAAVMTDAGALLIAAAVARAAVVRGDSRASIALGAAGVATLAISVPLQFAADEELSRAVHRFNQRFAR